MNIETQKLELIEWISRLQNIQVINEMLRIKRKEKIAGEEGVRKFGSGKHLIKSIAKDFDEPLEDFKEYME